MTPDNNAFLDQFESAMDAVRLVVSSRIPVSPELQHVMKLLSGAEDFVVSVIDGDCA